MAISGHQFQSALGFEECKLECAKYEWCRGILEGIHEKTRGSCRLLTNHSSPIFGWTYYHSGNWAEPTHWQESSNVFYRCLERIKQGYFEITVAARIH